MATLEDIRNYLTQNPGMSDAQIASAMQQYGVSPLQVAQATNMPVSDIQSRYDVASQQLQSQPIIDRASEILSGGGTAYDIAREAKIAGLTASDLAKASGMSESDIIRLSGGILNGGTIPPRPTFSGVASEWNAAHKDKYGTYLNVATTRQEDLKNQIQQLQDETKRRQSEWDSVYGDTPEGKIIKENPPPDWRDVYEPWVQTHIQKYGNIVNRPWSTDEAAINQKRELDEKYIKAIDDYNKKFGTNITPDPYAVGTFAQPSETYQEPEKEKWYDNPLNVAAALAAVYFGAPYLAEAIGGATAAGTGAAAGTAGTAGSALVPSAFDAAVTSALGGGSTLGTAGSVGTAGFGSALPSAAGLSSGLTAAGFAPGTAANLAGLTAAGTGATNLLGGATALAPVASGALPVSAPAGVEIIDRSIPFDPKAYDAISTTQGLSDLAKAGLETVTQNPIDALRVANTVKNIYDYATGQDQISGLFGDQGKLTSNLMSQGLAMLDPGSKQYALPGSLEATYLAAPSGAIGQQQQILQQLKQLYPELRGTDDKLLSTIQARVGGHIPEFITGKTGYYVEGRGDGQSDDIPAMLADGEYVFDADTVAALGNGSNKAGAKVLDRMRENIREHKRSAPSGKIPPKAKSPLEYMKG